MPRSKPFPLLSLPEVPLRLVFQIVTPVYLSRLSRCSKDTAQLARKTASAMHAYKIVVHFGSGRPPSIDLCLRNGIYRSHYTRLTSVENRLALYREAFGWKLTELVMAPSAEQVADAQEVLRKVTKFNAEQTSYEVDLRGVPNEHRPNILALCDTKRLKVSNADYITSVQFHENLKEVEFHNTVVCVSDILRSNLVTVRFSNYNVREGLLLLLLLWRKGLNHHLEVVFGDLSPVSWETIVRTYYGIRYLPNRIKHFKSRSGSVELEVKGGFDVRSSDGRIATVCRLDDEKYAFVVWHGD